ncbi:MAG: NAD(P)-binding protein, partial [Gemmatimonadota bacterium]|nr:NAD(P)-binding protein [Gemmatimonadota bacterium]
MHVLGAGPVGLVTAALLQSNDRFSVHLYEKRRDYTRTRMVQLAPYLVADSIADYCTDNIDGESIEAIFDPSELAEGLAFRQSMPPDLTGLLQGWTRGFCALNHIEHSLSELIDARETRRVERTTAVVTAEDAIAMLQPGDVLIDCTGTRSVLRDRLVPGYGAVGGEPNTFKLRLEFALVITFLHGEAYDCNEFCKYYKNIENPSYKFIPAVNRTCYDGRVTHVTGIVNITAEDYERMPSRCDGQWLRDNFPQVAQSMDRFITQIRAETRGEIVGDLEIVRIPLDLYRARNATSLELRRDAGDHPFARSPVFLAGDAAMGSPYFQSISLGFECAMFLAGLLAQRDLPETEMLERYERFIYQQWLRVYMRTKMIKHNKDLF